MRYRAVLGHTFRMDEATTHRCLPFISEPLEEVTGGQAADIYPHPLNVLTLSVTHLTTN